MIDPMRKKIFVFLVGLVILKSLLSYFVLSPSIFLDEVSYMRMAYDLLEHPLFKNLSFGYPPLYPLFISVAWLFKDINYVYLVIKILNAIFSSLIFIPAYMMAKEFCDKKRAFFAAILVSVLPFNFSFTPYVMAENLSFTLVFFTLFFVYKSIKDNLLRWNVLAGVFLGLSYLTRTINIVLLPVIIVLLFFKFNWNELRNKLILFISSLIIVIPWLINNYLSFGLGKGLLFGDYTSVIDLISSISIHSVIYWIVAYFGYIILSSGILLFISCINKYKLDSFTLLFILVIFGFVLISALYSSLYPKESLIVGRPLGRYIAPAISMIALYGMISLKKNFLADIKKKKLFLICLFVLCLSFLLVSKNITHLVPVNNLDLSYLGLLDRFFKVGLLGISIFLLILSFSPFMFRKLNEKTIIVLFFIFFMMVNLISISMIYHNSKEKWYNSEFMKAGLWFNDKKAKILFYEEEPFRANSPYIASFWITNPVSFGKNLNFSDFDYIVSSNLLYLKGVEQFGDIIIYKNG